MTFRKPAVFPPASQENT